MAEGEIVTDGTALQDADIQVAGEPSENGATPPQTPTWIPEAYRDNASVTRYQTVDDFIKGSLEREQVLGRTVQLPKDDASVEDRIAFNIGLRGEYLTKYKGELSYTTFFGADYNELEDRDFLSLSFSVAF